MPQHAAGALSDAGSPSSPAEAIALRVLRTIEKYGVVSERENQSWDGLSHFLPLVTHQVSNNEPVRLLLPGFPFKSPNAVDKVLGVLPDLGEELALARLNEICESVAAVYKHGAQLDICSDGLVYNDLLGISDEVVWNYGEGVRQIAKEKGYDRIRFIRLWHLLDHKGSWTKDFYLANAGTIRQTLLDRYRDEQFEADMANKSDEDMRMTHRSYIEFVSQDLAYHAALQGLEGEPREVKIHSVAKQMMGRWRAFASALEEARGSDHVRLSIHDSTGGGKLSLSLIPQQRGVVNLTPWHSVVVMEADGKVRTVPRSEVSLDMYELVFANGRPSHFRAR